MGGVIITLDENEAGKRFIELGLKEFAEKMDPYKQVGLNGQLEEGKISEEEYRREVCKKIGREVTFEELHFPVAQLLQKGMIWSSTTWRKR